MEIQNWDGTQNCAMKGYILYAVSIWNKYNPERPIEKDTVDNLFSALGWATDDLTATEAYRYYIKH